MEAILDSIRKKIGQWAMTTVMLTADANVGDDTIEIRSTRRFKRGDELLIRNAAEATEQRLYVAEVVDNYNLRLVDPLQFRWTVADNAAVIKTINDQILRAIHIGEPDILTEFPAITVNGTARNSEWYTIRATKERFNIEIGIYVQSDSHDDGYRFLLKMTDIIQKGLKKTIYPLVDDYNSTSLTQDIAANDTVIKFADVSEMTCGSFILIEDGLLCEPNTITEIIDANTVRVSTAFQNAFSVSDTQVIRPNRYIYNSWPADIQYGKIHKGTLLKAAVINFFVEETEIQGEGGFQDTSLS